MSNSYDNKKDIDINNSENLNESNENQINHIEIIQYNNQNININIDEDSENENENENGNEINNIEESSQSQLEIKNNDDEDDEESKESKETKESKESKESEEEKEEKEEEEEEEENENENENEEDAHREMIRQLTPYLQNKVNPNFNFPEVKDGTYVGIGLRRMKGYISIVPKDELEKRRISFWGTRIEGDPLVWNFLKELCDLPQGEEENMKAMLEANEITPLKKCINVTYDKAGEVYEIPNYCINDPVSYDLPEMHMKKPNQKKVSFFVRKGVKQIKIVAKNTTNIEKVKSNIGKKLGLDENKIRLFYRGKEMKNGSELWVYNIEDDCVVMIMYSG